MSAVAVPLFTAERAGRRLRAFAAEGPAPEMPWYALADLVAALATTRAEEVELLADLGAGALGLRLRSAVTEDGPLVLVDEPSAVVMLGAIGALEDGPSTLALTALLFAEAGRGACAVVVAGMSEAEAARWSAAANAAARAQLEREARRPRDHGPADG